MAKNIVIVVDDKNVSKVINKITNGAYPKWDIIDIQVKTLEEEE